MKLLGDRGGSRCDQGASCKDMEEKDEVEVGLFSSEEGKIQKYVVHLYGGEWQGQRTRHGRI
jgi:hypothetical protein